MKRLAAFAFCLIVLLAPVSAVLADTVTTSTTPAAVTAPSDTAPVTSVQVTPTVGGGTTVVTTSPPPIVIPWGDWVNAAINQVIIPILGTVIMTALAWASTKLPAALRAWLNEKNTLAVEQILERAIDSALNKVADASKGQALKVDVASPVLANATQFVIDKAPPKLVQYMGGASGVRELILARLPLEPGADGAQVLQETPQPVATKP